MYPISVVSVVACLIPRDRRSVVPWMKRVGYTEIRPQAPLVWVTLALNSLMLGAATSAQAKKRLALLIGNESYSVEIGRLSNPHNDVALLEKALEGLSFQVVVERDTGLGALTRAVNAMRDDLQAVGPNAVGLFYYSGQSASDKTTNYLIPVDVKTPESSELWDGSLLLTEVTCKLEAEAGNATHFVGLDAFRMVAPLAKTQGVPLERSLASMGPLLLRSSHFHAG
jgi:Caspase domain